MNKPRKALKSKKPQYGAKITSNEAMMSEVKQ